MQKTGLNREQFKTLLDMYNLTKEIKMRPLEKEISKYKKIIVELNEPSLTFTIRKEINSCDSLHATVTVSNTSTIYSIERSYHWAARVPGIFLVLTAEGRTHIWPLYPADTPTSAQMKELFDFVSVCQLPNTNNSRDLRTMAEVLEHVKSEGVINLTNNSSTELLKKYGYTLTEYEITDQDKDKIALIRNFGIGYNHAIGVIKKIAEGNNRRILLLEYFGRHSTKNRWKTITVNHNSAQYNYVDLGRFVIAQGTDSEYHSSRYSASIEYFLDDSFDISALSNIKKLYPGMNFDDLIRGVYRGVSTNTEPLVQTSAINDHYLPLIIRESKRQKDQELIKAVNSSFKSNLSTSKKLVLNEMEILNEKVTYAGQVIQVTDYVKNGKSFEPAIIDNFFSQYMKNNHRANISLILFDDIVEAILTYLDDTINDSNTCSFKLTLGNLTAIVEKTSKTGTSGITQGRLTINGIRINLREGKEVLEHLLCFSKPSEFEKFLTDVSGCSLAIHSLVAEGMEVSYRDSFLEKTVNYMFHLERIDRKNYLKGIKKDERYKIKNINSFASKFRNAYSIEHILQYLNDEKLFETIPAPRVAALMKKANEVHLAALERSKKLLADTIEMLDVKETNIELEEGRGGYSSQVPVYEVKGEKRTYYIKKNGNHDVYTENRRRLCIVDKSLDIVGKDKLVSRMLAVANDSRVSDKIHTLK
jgi:hypothetical protein